VKSKYIARKACANRKNAEADLHVVAEATTHKAQCGNIAPGYGQVKADVARIPRFFPGGPIAAAHAGWVPFAKALSAGGMTGPTPRSGAGE